MKSVFYVLLLLPLMALGDAVQIDDYRWKGVDRIVAVGDLHGDYENYLATLRAAGLINDRGRWTGGKTHLVQTGDIPDRGPDTLKIIDHLEKLSKQARRKGGRVHVLMGNHEAMNAYGDLRYVHEGEFEAFVTRRSEELRDRYFELYMQSLREQDPQRFEQLPADFRDQWNVKHPLGWVEHQQAWNPVWNPEGEYATWTLDRKIAIQINDILFVHGGISGFYCRNSLESMTEKAVTSLSEFDPENPGIIEDEFGPLWFRGLSGGEPRAAEETVEAILEHHGAEHIVVGHTPTSGVIWPRYDGRVIQIDTGISRAYGGYVGYLEVTPEGMYAGYPDARLRLPEDDEQVLAYLERVIALRPDNPHLHGRLEALRHPPEAESETDARAGEAESEPPPPEEPAVEPIPICGSR